MNRIWDKYSVCYFNIYFPLIIEICRLFINYDFTTIRTSQVEKDLSPKDLWKTCVYGAHPQTLLVASRISADLFDFRVFSLFSKKYINIYLVIYINLTSI